MPDVHRIKRSRPEERHHAGCRGSLTESRISSELNEPTTYEHPVIMVPPLPHLVNYHAPFVKMPHIIDEILNKVEKVLLLVAF